MWRCLFPNFFSNRGLKGSARQQVTYKYHSVRIVKATSEEKTILSLMELRVGHDGQDKHKCKWLKYSSRYLWEMFTVANRSGHFQLCKNKLGVKQVGVIRKCFLALDGVAQWIECQPENHRVADSIPSQGTCLGCGPGPQWGARERQPPVDVSLPLFPSL